MLPRPCYTIIPKVLILSGDLYKVALKGGTSGKGMSLVASIVGPTPPAFIAVTPGLEPRPLEEVDGGAISVCFGIDLATCAG